MEWPPYPKPSRLAIHFPRATGDKIMKDPNTYSKRAFLSGVGGALLPFMKMMSVAPAGPRQSKFRRKSSGAAPYTASDLERARSRIRARRKATTELQVLVNAMSNPQRCKYSRAIGKRVNKGAPLNASNDHDYEIMLQIAKALLGPNKTKSVLAARRA
jgi:hypothetical protein